jgi:hypothetical protein
MSRDILHESASPRTLIPISVMIFFWLRYQRLQGTPPVRMTPVFKEKHFVETPLGSRLHF